ncbi:sensor domain-containing protein [Candidatus Magnetomonas plexicatena]|uniref:sensor domain-containing protein n=1 Tax=Candidatus Magnetomonas plexicatena TaxID=2552947 RepID=UPI001C75B880|nr:EAL domain-containing protein [Nitrospirales bacterium LBB_01]
MVKACFLDDILRSSLDMAVVACDLDFRIIYYNPMAARYFDCPEAEALGKSFTELQNNRLVIPDELSEAVKRVRDDGEISYVHKKTKNAQNIFLESRLSCVLNNDGDVIGYVFTSRDITTMKTLSDTLSYRVTLENLAASVSAGLISIPSSELYPEMKISLERLAEALNAESAYLAVYNDDDDIIHQWHHTTVSNLMDDATLLWFKDRANIGKITFYDKTDTSVAANEFSPNNVYSVIIVSLVYGERQMGFIAIASETQHRQWQPEEIVIIKMVSEIFVSAMIRKETEEKLHKLAHYDILTNVPNRMLFNDRLCVAMEQARRHDTMLALLFIDLDRFKKINDTLGHDIGDLLLKEAAGRIELCTRKSDTVARMGGDEFTVIMTNLQRSDDVSRLAAKIITALSAPFFIKQHECSVEASIGISVFPADTDDVVTLLKNADIALYQVKEHGRGDYQFFSPSMNKRSIHKLNLENRLRKALKTDEFSVLYQPQIGINSGNITGMEVIVRWISKESGYVPSFEFIPIAEESGLILSLGKMVFRQVCMVSKEWADMGFNHLAVSIKVLESQFRHRDLLDVVQRILKETGANPALLDVTIDENTAMTDVEQSISILKKLKNLGFSITIDNFGTGYSSLSHLKRFPADTLKINKTFINNITVDTDYASIAKAIIALAHTLGLKVVAEGVETNEQLEFLRAVKCDAVQGTLFTPALTQGDVLHILNDEAHFKVRS